MAIQQDFVDANDGSGARLFFRSIDPTGEVKGSVVISHGYAEHGGRYERHMVALAEAGYAVIAPDHRGHGRTAAKLGLVESFDALVADLSLYRTMAATKHEGKPVFMLGHSMGGMATLLHIVRHAPNLHGAIVIAPAIEVPDNIPQIMIKISKVLSKIAPSLGVQAFFDATELSTRPDIQQAARMDPLFYRGKIRARTGAQLYDAMVDVNAQLGSIDVPMLLLHGGADPVVKAHVQEVVMSGIASKDKTGRVFDNARHEILNETCEAEVVEAIIGWLDAHVG